MTGNVICQVFLYGNMSGLHWDIDITKLGGVLGEWIMTSHDVMVNPSCIFVIFAGHCIVCL
jgi:hypothetical protein